jgi:charged multivesicular body protein 5
MEDLIEQANEIQETMGRTYGVPDEVDEADLEAGSPHDASRRSHSAYSFPPSELEALGTDLLEEEEMPSYLKDTTALPDFVDEAPVDAERVSVNPVSLAKMTNRSRHRIPLNRRSLDSTITIPIPRK